MGCDMKRLGQNFNTILILFCVEFILDCYIISQLVRQVIINANLIYLDLCIELGDKTTYRQYAWKLYDNIVIFRYKDM